MEVMLVLKVVLKLSRVLIGLFGDGRMAMPALFTSTDLLRNVAVCYDIWNDRPSRRPYWSSILALTASILASEVTSKTTTSMFAVTPSFCSWDMACSPESCVRQPSR